MKSQLTQDIEAIRGVFAALGDDTRLSLVERLATEGPQTLTNLLLGTRLTRQAVSKHLFVLEKTGIVTRERVGREIVFTSWPQTLNRARTILRRLAQSSARRRNTVFTARS